MSLPIYLKPHEKEIIEELKLQGADEKTIQSIVYDFKGKKGEQVKCSKIRLKDYTLDICTTNQDIFELPIYTRFTAVIKASSEKVQDVEIKEVF